MGYYNIKVTEFGIINKNGDVHPSYYDWRYCIKKNIPQILVYPKIKYSSISYDLLSISGGITFKEPMILHNYWLAYYDDYIKDKQFPIGRIRLAGGSRNLIFSFYKEDQEEILSHMMIIIQEYVNTYGIVDDRLLKDYNSLQEINTLNSR